MSVHYKFKSTLDYDTVSFDGLHISVADLKKAIFHQKRIGKNTDFDLQITNAQTKEDYTDDNALIAKNTSLIIARVPLTAQQKRIYERAEAPTFNNVKDDATLGRSVDLTRLDGSEEDKIRAMMTQSTQEYDPSNYIKIRGATQTGEVPPNYRCYKCHQPGHWIKNCPLGGGQEPIEIKKSTGIPRSFMVPVDGPSVPGAMMTPGGTYAVPAIDHQAYKEGKKEKPPFSHDPEPVMEKPEIPEDLLCNICKDLLTDAVMIPCCGNSFCDECIRTFLLDSEEHECPDCNEKDVSPESLIPNRYLRNAVLNFRNETGYAKRPTFKPPPARLPMITEQTISEKLTASPSMSAATPAGTIPVGARDSSQSGEAEAKEADQPIGKGSPSYEKAANASDLVAKLTADDEAEVPPPPGTEAAIPKIGSDHMWHETSPELSDDEYSRNRYSRERRRSFSRDNHRDRNTAYHGRVDSGMRSGSRRRSLSPRNSHGYPPHKGYHGPSDNRYHQAPMHYDSNLRRSTEDRAGTPTVDEPHLHPPPHGPPPMMTYAPPDPAAGYSAPPPVVAHNQPIIPDPYMQAAAPPPRMPMYPQPPTHGYGPPPPVPPQRYDGRPPYQPGYRPPRPPNTYSGPPRSMRGMHVGYRGMQPPPPGMSRGMHNGTQGVIEDPLEAFQRMLREKDERDRRLGKHRRRTRSRSRSRSYSRSRSRSFGRGGGRGSPARLASRSRSPPPKRRVASRSPPPSKHRTRSRTPKKRRSRSGSFSISRYHKERDRERAIRPRSREPYGSYYGDTAAPPPTHEYSAAYREPRQERTSRYSSRGPSAASQSSAALLPPPPPGVVAAGSQVPPTGASSTTGLHLPPLDRKDYYDSYNRYPATAAPTAPRFNKRYDDVAPPGTEGYYDLIPPGVDHLERPVLSKERPPLKDKDGVDRFKEDRHRDGKSRSGRGDRREHERYERRSSPERKRLKRSTSPYSSKQHREAGKEHTPDKSRKRDKEHEDKSDERKKEKKLNKEKKKKKDSEDKEKKKKKKEKKEKKAALIQKEAAAAAAIAAASAVVSSTTLPVVKVKQEPPEVAAPDVAVPPASPAAEPPPPAVKVKSEPLDEAATEEKPVVEEAAEPESLSPKPVEQAAAEPCDSQATASEQEPTEESSFQETLPDEAEISTTSSCDVTKLEPEEPPAENGEDDLLQLTETVEIAPVVERSGASPKKDEFLAALPELSKWERDEGAEKVDESSATPEKEPPECDDPKGTKVVTTEVLKRAENAIFQKAINAIRPIEIKKISESRKVLYQNPEPKILEPEVDTRKTVNVTITVNKNERNVEISNEPIKKSKSERTKLKNVQTSPSRLSIKERLGEKVDDETKKLLDQKREAVKGEAPLKTKVARLPKERKLPLLREKSSPIIPNPERKVFVGERRKERARLEARHSEESARIHDRSDRKTRTPPPIPNFKPRISSSHSNEEDESKDDRKKDKKTKEDKKRKKEHRSRSKSRDRKKRKDKKHKKERSSRAKHSSKEKDTPKEKPAEEDKEVIETINVETYKKQRKNPRLVSDRKKSVLDESNFEPDYSASDSESDNEGKSTPVIAKKPKLDDSVPSAETETKAKKRPKPSSSEDDSSSSESSSSESDSSVESHRKKKKKHKKRKKRKAKRDSSSDSEVSSDSSNSSSEEEKHRKKKKSKSKKQAKKKKKSKHK